MFWDDIDIPNTYFVDAVVFKGKRKRPVRYNVGRYGNYKSAYKDAHEIMHGKKQIAYKYSFLEIVDRLGNAVKATDAVPPEQIGDLFIP